MKHYCDRCGTRITKTPTQCKGCHKLIHWEKKGFLKGFEPVNNKPLTKDEAKIIKMQWKIKLDKLYKKKGFIPNLKYKLFGEPSKTDRRRRRATTEEMAWVFKKYGTKCVTCGSPHDLTVDHIIPLARGGDWSIENLQPMCKSCNSSKGARV